jgi:hypothetical protein
MIPQGLEKGSRVLCGRQVFLFLLKPGPLSLHLHSLFITSGEQTSGYGKEDKNRLWVLMQRL